MADNEWIFDKIIIAGSFEAWWNVCIKRMDWSLLPQSWWLYG